MMDKQQRDLFDLMFTSLLQLLKDRANLRIHNDTGYVIKALQQLAYDLGATEFELMGIFINAQNRFHSEPGIDIDRFIEESKLERIFRGVDISDIIVGKEDKNEIR
jgi:hypothetical protein